jgi:hypothetical protein
LSYYSSKDSGDVDVDVDVDDDDGYCQLLLLDSASYSFDWQISELKIHTVSLSDDASEAVSRKELGAAAAAVEVQGLTIVDSVADVAVTGLAAEAG